MVLGKAGMGVPGIGVPALLGAAVRKLDEGVACFAAADGGRYVCPMAGL